MKLLSHNPVITAIQAQKERKGRVNIFLNSAFSFGIAAEVAAGLKVGQELPASRIEELTEADLFHQCYEAALHYLNYRLRSESELKGRLFHRGFDGGVTEKVISKLKKQGLVDNIAFAQFWRYNRDSFSPRSRNLVKQELKQKGIASDIIEQVTENLDDEASAYRAASKRIRLAEHADYGSFRQRLSTYLRRRGFNYDVIKRTIDQLWKDRETKPELVRRLNMGR